MNVTKAVIPAAGFETPALPLTRAQSEERHTDAGVGGERQLTDTIRKPSAVSGVEFNGDMNAAVEQILRGELDE